jgi:hypothetical protein
VGSARAFGSPPGPFQEASSALALLKGDKRGPPSRHNFRVAEVDNDGDVAVGSAKGWRALAGAAEGKP